MRALSETRTFWCPGCKEVHQLDARWTIAGPDDAPSATPSLLVRSGHYVPGRGPDAGCWCSSEYQEEGWPACVVCHLFVREGRIEYLSDSTHHLAGQAVPLEVR